MKRVLNFRVVEGDLNHLIIMTTRVVTIRYISTLGEHNKLEGCSSDITPLFLYQ